MLRIHGFQGKAVIYAGEEIILKSQENMKSWITSVSRPGNTWRSPRQSRGESFSKRTVGEKGWMTTQSLRILLENRLQVNSWSYYMTTSNRQMYKLVTDELKGKVSSRQLLRSENTAKKIRSNGATNRSREKIRSFIHLPMSPAITAKKSVHNYSKKGGSKLNQEVSL